MIFAQYKHAITFAVVILGLAVLVADPGSGDADDAAKTQQTEAAPGLASAPAPAPETQAAPAADAEWYGEAEGPATPPVADTATAAVPTPAPASPAAPDYMPPPPPPQVPPGG